MSRTWTPVPWRLLMVCGLGLACEDKGDDSVVAASGGATTSLDDACEESGDPPTSWFPDVDGDGFGAPDESLSACDQPEGYVADNTDCADDDADRHPGAIEYCNGSDDDCDGEIDEDDGAGDATWYIDEDADGYGSEEQTVISCEAPEGYVCRWRC